MGMGVSMPIMVAEVEVQDKRQSMRESRERVEGARRGNAAAQRVKSLKCGAAGERVVAVKPREAVGF